MRNQIMKTRNFIVRHKKAIAITSVAMIATYTYREVIKEQAEELESQIES